VAIDGTVQPSEVVAGYAARHQIVKGKCTRTGCNRRVELDPKALCGEGLGTVPMQQVKAWWKCQRAGGCALIFFNEPPAFPLRLEHFTGLPHVRVRLSCRGNGCKFTRLFTAEAMIKGLVARGQGDERVEIAKLGAKMTSGCPLCKKANWTADVLWANTDTMGWKAQGSAYFERYETG
jgi:hypothetical protein